MASIAQNPSGHNLEIVSEINALASHMLGRSNSRVRGSGAARRKGSETARKSEAMRRSWARAKNFLAVDGEAIEGRYVLLACSDGSSIETLDGVSTYECLEYLTTRSEKTLWGFAFDYDVNQILSGLSTTQLTKLARRNSLYFGEYRIMHIPGKLFRVTNRSLGTTVSVWDAFSFVRKSFAHWIEKWGLLTGDELEFIKEMKDLRSTFTDSQFDTVRRYCFAELDYLHRGVDELIDRVRAAGYRPSGWYSPGSISASAMRAKGVLVHKKDPPTQVDRPAKRAYFGGRFETRVTGKLSGSIYHYDIRSAYPAALVDLPCLACGSWERLEPGEVDLNHPYTLVKVAWRAPTPYKSQLNRPPWGPFTVRLGAGSLRYPVCHSGGWYWSPEVKAASPLTRLKIFGGWRFNPGCEHQPFDWIPELYEMRAELKRRDDPAEYTYKLILNSCYGKLAQRQRQTQRRIPAFRSIVWAGIVTSKTRGLLLDAIAMDPKAVMQLATDGLTSTRKLPLKLGPGLGEWEMKRLQKLFIVQSGIYFWQDKHGDPFQRSRGFHPSTLTYERCLEAWRNGPTKPIVFENTRFVGYRSALHRNALEDWRTWQTYKVHISMMPEPRRERWLRRNGHQLSVPPICASPDILDFLSDGDFRVGELWDGEQPDGPDGGVL